jgi:hypothetical protein
MTTVTASVIAAWVQNSGSRAAPRTPGATRVTAT